MPFVGEDGSDGAGGALDAGDLDGDGLDDVLVGARAAGRNTAARVYVVSSTRDPVRMATPRGMGTLTAPHEVPMLLSLVSTAFALTVPVTAKISDELNNNGNEMRQTITGTVAVTNPATGAVFRVGTEELTVNKREGKGSGGIFFAGDTANSIRTWAVYYLDASGAVLGDPEVVTVVFDAKGSVSIAARDSGRRTADFYKGPDSPSSQVPVILRVDVQDSGVDASLVGIVELTNDRPGSDLQTDADMGILDADTFATFQELGLDAVIAIDSRTVTLQGDVSVSGLSVATDGTVEGGAELRWDVTLYDPSAVTCTSRVCDTPTLSPVATVSYLETIGAVKKKSGQPAAVKLQPQDVTYDSWELGVGLVLPGEQRDLEIAASLDFEGGAGSDIVTLDPGTLGVCWELGGCGGNKEPCNEPGGCCTLPDIFIDGDHPDLDYASPDDVPDWADMADELFEIEVLDSAGGFVASHICTMSPTARTLAGTGKYDVLVGECTGGDSGTEVRRFTLKTPNTRWTGGTDDDTVPWEWSAGKMQFEVEMAGAAFTAERTGGECSRLGGCTEETVSVLGGTISVWHDGALLRQPGPIAVTEAEFSLPFSFAEDVSGMTGELLIEFDDPTYDLTWVTTDEALLGYYGDRLMRTIAFADVDLVSDNRELRCGAFGASTSSRPRANVICKSWAH
ncbi:MAG: hypothetical protein V4850_37335 [Myxococcota bacterium]